MQINPIKKISHIQLVVLFVASRLFSESMNFPLDNTKYGMQRFAVILTAYVILFIQYIPLIYVSKKYNESALGLMTESCRPLGWVYGAVLTAAVLTSAVCSICRMKFYASSTIFGQAPDYLLVILPLIAVAFAVWKGMQATARSGVVFAAVFVGFLILISVSVWELFNAEWLYPAIIDDPDSFLPQVAEQIGSNSEIMYFAVLAEHVSEKAEKTIYRYVPAVVILLELMYLLEILVLGPFLSSTSFPFFTVSALSNIVLFQRLDGIDVAVWTLMCIVKVTLGMLCIRTIYNRLAGYKAGIIASMAGIVTVAALSIMFGGSSEFVTGVTKILTCGIPMIISGIIFPLTAIIIKKVRNSRGKEAASGEGR